MMQKERGLLLLLMFVSVSSGAQVSGNSAEPGPKFGPEFTVTGEFLNSEEDAERTAELFKLRSVQHLVHGQKDSARFLYNRASGEFWSPNGWMFQVATDAGALEFTTNPMTLGEFTRYASDLQDAIFVTAANMNLFPAPFLGGGHINIDLEYLLDRPMLFRNFMADLLINHVELFMGIFGYDTNNALPAIMLSPQIHNEIIGIFHVFDYVKNPERSDAFALAINLNQYFTSFADNLEINDGYSAFWQNGKTIRGVKYYSVAIWYRLNESRLELRGVRAQPSMDVWVRQIRLLRNRMRYLESLNTRIPIKLKFDLKRAYVDKMEVRAIETQALNPPIAGFEALEQFKVYVEESGEKIEEHLDYVWPAWQTDGSLREFKQKYLLGLQPKTSKPILQNGILNCNELLKGNE